jgi:predicted kinase
MAAAGGGVDRQFDDLSIPFLICMAGLPGAGKSTIAEILGARLGAPIISVDPIESAILSAGIASEQPTGLAAYLVAETMAEQTLVAGRTVIVDAVNAVEPARLQWRALAERMKVEIKVIEVICSDAGLHRSRLENRVRNLPHFSELSWHSVEQSLEEYTEWIGDVAELPRITLDTVNPIGQNVEKAFEFLES